MKRRDCKDTWDRIFALRSLLSKPSALILKLDYIKNVNLIYMEFARKILRRGYIEILYYIGI